MEENAQNHSQDFTQKKEKEKVSLKIQKRMLLLALEQSLGVVTTACKGLAAKEFKAAGDDQDRSAMSWRKKHYTWLQKDKQYQEAVEDLENVALDYSESKLHSRITVGDTTAIIFHLKTKGKKRGYIENPNIINQNNVHGDIMLGYGQDD